MFRITRKLTLLLLLAIACCTVTYADQAHSQTIFNSLKYVRGLDTKQLNVIVVYDHSKPASEDEAKKMAESFRQINGVASVTVHDITKAIDYPKSGVLYVPQEMDAHFSSITSLAKASKLLPVSTSLSCVQSSCCALSYLQAKRLDIYLNRNTLRDLGFEVDATFNFMVKRI